MKNPRGHPKWYKNRVRVVAHCDKAVADWLAKKAAKHNHTVSRHLALMLEKARRADRIRTKRNKP